MIRKSKNINLISDERRTHDLQSVAAMVKPLAKGLLGKSAFTEIDILTNWNEIVGAEIAELSLPQYLKFKRGEKNNGVLTVQVASGAVALEFQHRETYIISKINAYFGYNVVKNIKFVQNNELLLMAADTIDSVQGKQKILVTDEEENYIKALSEGIENPDLKQKLINLGLSVWANDKDKK